MDWIVWTVFSERWRGISDLGVERRHGWARDSVCGAHARPAWRHGTSGRCDGDAFRRLVETSGGRIQRRLRANVQLQQRRPAAWGQLLNFLFFSFFPLMHKSSELSNVVHELPIHRYLQFIFWQGSSSELFCIEWLMLKRLKHCA